MTLPLQVITFTGFGGTGKSTLAKRFEEERNAIVVASPTRRLAKSEKDAQNDQFELTEKWIEIYTDELLYAIEKACDENRDYVVADRWLVDPIAYCFKVRNALYKTHPHWDYLIKNHFHHAMLRIKSELYRSRRVTFCHYLMTNAPYVRQDGFRIDENNEVLEAAKFTSTCQVLFSMLDHFGVMQDCDASKFVL